VIEASNLTAKNIATLLVKKYREERDSQMGPCELPPEIYLSPEELGRSREKAEAMATRTPPAEL